MRIVIWTRDTQPKGLFFFSTSENLWSRHEVVWRRFSFSASASSFAFTAEEMCIAQVSCVSSRSTEISTRLRGKHPALHWIPYIPLCWDSDSIYPGRCLATTWCSCAGSTGITWCELNVRYYWPPPSSLIIWPNRHPRLHISMAPVLPDRPKTGRQGWRSSFHQCPTAGSTR